MKKVGLLRGIIGCTMTELGQEMFGNKWESHDCPGYVEKGIYALSEEIGHHDAQMHGYGHEFENNVFEMHPYYWGTCECGFERDEIDWDESHSHAEDCYQSELERRGGWKGDTASQLAKEWGFSEYGCAVHCSCTFQQEWQDWRSTNDHEPSCRVVLPNFRHKVSGFSVHWYKYMGRSQTMSRAIAPNEWRTILRECEDSLVGKL